MRMTLILFIIILNNMVSFTQERPQDAYFYEESGYLICPVQSQFGIIATNNYANSLYLINQGELTELFSSPGCGRYFTISPDGYHIGFKLIKDALQQPVLFNLKTNELTSLHTPVKICGQVYFSEQNQVVFSIGNDIHLLDGEHQKTFQIGTYANLTPISPDGNFIAYNASDKIFLLNLRTGQSRLISLPESMSVYPQFSPDSKTLLYQSGGEMLIYNIISEKTINLGEAIGPKWSPDSKKIIFYKTRIEQFDIVSSDLYLIMIEKQKEIRLTNTPGIFEMQPLFSSNHNILYHTFKDNELVSMEIIDNIPGDINIEFKVESQLDLKHYTTDQKTKDEVRIPGSIPYTHQVYDTPNWHNGYGSCAPACAIMAIGYFNRLPEWPITCSWPTTHTSNFGSYVADKYRLDQFYYDIAEPTSGGEDAWGGYGYMWGLGSPNSYMASYISGHYLTSNQLWTTSCTYTNTTNEIDNGFPHPICAWLTSAGHLVLAKGYVVGQYTLIFSEPYGDKNTPGWPSYDGENAYYDWPGYNNGFQNLDADGSHGYIAWTVTARGAEVIYNDTIIDDLNYNHGFSINNSENGSKMRYYHDLNTGYNNHMWYTYTIANAADICWVNWRPNISQSGMYEVSAYIPDIAANASEALYKVHHSEGNSSVLVDQSVYSNQWVSLGNYHFDISSDSYVYLGDSTGITGESLAFDAIRWHYLPVPSANYYVSSQSVCVGESIQITNLTTNATSYSWFFEGGTPSTSNDTNPVITYLTEGVFDITLIAIGPGGIDTLTRADYISVFYLAVADFESSDTIIYLPNAMAAFNNYSTYSEAYSWDFGNGQSSTEMDPICTYTAQGDYTISLVASNNNCANDTVTYYEYIHVLLPLGVSETADNAILIYPNPVKEILHIKSNSINGVVIFNAEGIKVENYRITNNQVDCSELPRGTYLLQISKRDGTMESVTFIKN